MLDYKCHERYLPIDFFRSSATILTRSKEATLEPDLGWNAWPTIKLDP